MKQLVTYLVGLFRRLGVLTVADAQEARHEAVARVVYRLGVPRTARVLDIGCGEGALLQRFSSDGFSALHGCDWHERPLPGVKFRRLDLNATGLEQYESASFDVVVCSDVIEHVENPSALLREMARILRPGGHAVVTMPNCANAFERLHFLVRGNSSRYQPQRYGPHGHINYLPSWVLEHLTVEAGLRIDALEGDAVLFRGHSVRWLPATPRWSYSVVAHLRA